MTIFEDFTIAISQPSRYGEFLKRNNFAYRFFVFILVSLISLAYIVYPTVTAVRTAKEWYEYKIPDFKIEDGTLYVKKDFTFDEKPVLIKLSNEKEFKENETNDYQFALLCDENKFILKTNGNVISGEYKEAGKDFKLLKNDIYESKNILVISVVITDIILFGIAFGIFFLGAFFVQLLTKSFLKMLKLELSKKEHFRLCVYSMTTPCLLSAVLVLLNFGSLSALGLIISMIYIYRALINMKENQKTNVDE